MIRPMKTKRVLSAIQPSGEIHLGNYYGAIKPFAELQKEGFETLFFVANLHAMTTLQDAAKLREYSAKAAAACIALGIDPKKTTLFYQSDVPAVTELYWILNNLVTVPYLARGHAYKDKLTEAGAQPGAGLLTYPVLQAADILLYGTDLVPVGKDQEQHLEMARDIAQRFNKQFNKNVMILPEPLITPGVGTILGVDGRKMSKSYGNTIPIFADDKEIERLVMGIKTDGTDIMQPKPKEGPLYQLCSLICPHIAKDYDRPGVGYGAFKRDLLYFFHQTFDKPRALYQELIKDNYSETYRILTEGRDVARDYARGVDYQVKQATGIY